MEPIWIAFLGAVTVVAVMSGIGLYVHFSKNNRAPK